MTSYDRRDLIVLPRLAPDGCRIVLNVLKDGDPANYVFEDHQKLMLMLLDALVMAEPTLPGIYIIYDLDLGLISHFWKFGFWLQRKLFAYLKVGWAAYLPGSARPDPARPGPVAQPCLACDKLLR